MGERKRRARTFKRAAPVVVEEKVPPIRPGHQGGLYNPLSQREMERIHETVLKLMENVGFADATDSMIDIITAGGGFMSGDRLCFPRSLVEDVIAGHRQTYTMFGISPEHDLEIGKGKVHMGTGGAAPMMKDFNSGHYRGSTVTDLYDLARLVDQLPNIHYFWRMVVASDMPSPRLLDLNTAYASMMGTEKHIGVSFINGLNVYEAVQLFDMAKGGEGKFRERPFCTISCCHVVPPLRFAQESCDALEAAIRSGMVATLLSAPMAGATSPSALAGTIVQSLAESLAGMVFAFLIDPMCRTNLGNWAFVTDLRTGSMTSGSPELALIVAGCAQMARFYDLPGSVAAGMADSKALDAQSGAEKAYTLTLAAQAGSSMINESAGMQGSLLGASFESVVFDNDTLGAVQRTVRGIEVNDETLSYETIRDVVNGEGHFLGTPQTMIAMESDFLYPDLGDRQTPAVWEEQGAKDISELAREKTVALLKDHYPTHFSSEIDDKIREHFEILLPRAAMRPGNGRW